METNILSTPIIIQWGFYSNYSANTGIATVTYPISFSSIAIPLLTSTMAQSMFTNRSTAIECQTSFGSVVYQSVNLTDFKCQQSGGEYWIAIGY